MVSRVTGVLILARGALALKYRSSWITAVNVGTRKRGTVPVAMEKSEVLVQGS